MVYRWHIGIDCMQSILVVILYISRNILLHMFKGRLSSFQYPVMFQTAKESVYPTSSIEASIHNPLAVFSKRRLVNCSPGHCGTRAPVWAVSNLPIALLINSVVICFSMCQPTRYWVPVDWSSGLTSYLQLYHCIYALWLLCRRVVVPLSISILSSNFGLNIGQC